MTPAGCGLKWSGLSLRSGRAWSFSKTCPALFDTGKPSEPSLPAWPTSGSMRNGRVYARSMSVRRTRGSACSSSPTGGKSWSTSTVRCGRLEVDAKTWGEMWLTPTTTGCRNLAWAAKVWTLAKGKKAVRYSRPGLMMQTAGVNSLASGPTSRRRLSARFVEYLQGLPIGLTELY
jgi:hypothetical protein